jgi:hypothetical protein
MRGWTDSSIRARAASTQRRFDPAPPFERARGAAVPKRDHRARDRAPAHGIGVLAERPLQRRADVVGVGLDRRRPAGERHLPRALVGRFREVADPPGVAMGDAFALAVLREFFERVRTRGLEEPIARVVRADVAGHERFLD